MATLNSPLPHERKTVPIGRPSAEPEDAWRFTQLAEENRALRTALSRSESQAAALMQMYVTLRHMHSVLDPAQVLAAIVDSLSNLLGAEAFAVLFSHGEPRVHSVAFVEGMDVETDYLYGDGRYRGGNRLVDAALSSGSVQIASLDAGGERGTLRPTDGPPTVAAVPLTFRGRVFGCVVIERLLAQRRSLDENDRMLLELLADQAGSALLAARAYAAGQRLGTDLSG